MPPINFNINFIIIEILGWINFENCHRLASDILKSIGSSDTQPVNPRTMSGWCSNSLWVVFNFTLALLELLGVWKLLPFTLALLCLFPWYIGYIGYTPVTGYLVNTIYKVYTLKKGTIQEPLSIILKLKLLSSRSETTPAHCTFSFFKQMTNAKVSKFVSTLEHP